MPPWTGQQALGPLATSSRRLFDRGRVDQRLPSVCQRSKPKMRRFFPQRVMRIISVTPSSIWYSPYLSRASHNSTARLSSCRPSIADQVQGSPAGPMLFYSGRLFRRGCPAPCNKMLAGDMRSPLWPVSRLVLIPKPLDPPTDGAYPGPPSARPLCPLNLPEIFYRLTARAAVQVESSSVGAVMEPLQLGVGIPSGCQIRAKKAQCAFDARRTVEAFDLDSAFTKERRRDTFQGVYKRAPRLLAFYASAWWEPG